MLAIIPAKSNSERLPGKNITILNNKPLIMHTIELANNSVEISEVYVTSNSNKILDIAKKSGVKIIQRPEELCRSNVTNFEVCKHVIEVLQKKGKCFTSFALLQVTHPFRNVLELDEAIKFFKNNKEFDTLVTVKRRHRISGEIVKNSLKLLNDKREIFEISGHLYLRRLDSSNLIKDKNILGKSIYPFKLPKNWHDIDIDTANDLLFAKALFKK